MGFNFLTDAEIGLVLEGEKSKYWNAKQRYVEIRPCREELTRVADKKDEGKGSGGWKALFTGASAANGALFGSILGPLGALGGAILMGGSR